MFINLIISIIMEGVEKMVKSKSKTLLAFCFCFIIGAGIASVLDFQRDWLGRIYPLVLAAIFFAAFFWNNPKLRFVSICLFIIFSGCLRYLVTLPDPADSGHVFYYSGEQADLKGTVSVEPKINTNKSEYIFSRLTMGDRPLAGKIIAQLPPYPEYRFGERAYLSCYLEQPKNFPGSGFNYEKYLASKGVSLICQNPVISKTEPPSGIVPAIYNFKSKVSAQVARLWPEPASSLIGGLLYGDRSGLPKDLADNFSRTGLSHIIAVSGYNISMIAAALMLALISLGLYRRQAFWLAVFGIIIFVIFTGASSSAVRAGVMGVVVLVGQYLGRPSRAAPALLLAAALMVFANPYVLIWDAGFQLSFAATAGILYLAPVIYPAQKEQKEDGLLAGFCTTLSAIIATLPLILYQFGRLSVVALPVNVLILWIIPYLMLFGFISIAAGCIFFPLGQVLAWITGFGLQYILTIVEFFGRQNWSAVDVKISWWLMAAMYAVIAYLIIMRSRYEKK